jgi:hypothetical protein
MYQTIFKNGFSFLETGSWSFVLLAALKVSTLGAAHTKLPSASGTAPDASHSWDVSDIQILFVA